MYDKFKRVEVFIRGLITIKRAFACWCVGGHLSNKCPFAAAFKAVLLTYRYINGLTREKDAEEMHYSYKHVTHELHPKALLAAALARRTTLRNIEPTNSEKTV